MYLDIMDNITVNKKLIKYVGIETAVYWAELVSILKQVSKKKTCDERGFFKLDRAFVERETSIKPERQIECDAILSGLGILVSDPNDPNRLAVSVQNMIALITDEDPSLLTGLVKQTKKSESDKAEGKKAGMKFNLKNAIVETDMELKKKFDTWVEAMVDAGNCRFTKAVVELFVKTVREYSSDKAAQGRVVELATIHTYKDASWAINLHRREVAPRFTQSRITAPTPVSDQKVGTAVKADVSF
jgi:hypothetical protein